MPRKMNRVFARQPSNLGGGGSRPLGPLRPLGYFGLPMMDLVDHHYHQTNLIVDHLIILSM